jgi:hypothetical protein
VSPKLVSAIFIIFSYKTRLCPPSSPHIKPGTLEFEIIVIFSRKKIPAKDWIVSKPEPINMYSQKTIQHRNIRKPKSLIFPPLASSDAGNFISITVCPEGTVIIPEISQGIEVIPDYAKGMYELAPASQVIFHI